MTNNTKAHERRADENMRNVETLKNVAMILVEDLHRAGRADLTPPFLDVLRALAAVDYVALAEVDAAVSTRGGAR